MVVFRLTQEEYIALRDACQSKGGRNLSEFTRSELLSMLRSEGSAPMLDNRFHDLELTLRRLEAAVAELAGLFGCGDRVDTAPVRRLLVP